MDHFGRSRDLQPEKQLSLNQDPPPQPSHRGVVPVGIAMADEEEGQDVEVPLPFETKAK